MRRSSFIGLGAGLLTCIATSSAAWAISCDSLTGVQLTGGQIRSAEMFPGGDMTTNGPMGPSRKITVSGLPAFCKVTAVMKPTPESNIVVEIWLPDAAKWNGKLLGTGNGAFAGSIRNDMLISGIKRNYATANTDMGTSAAKGSYQGGLGHREMIRDWGFRATHEMTVAAKEILAVYYGRHQKEAYFNGCSTGGHQGLTEAQRYPDDYNGILVGAPGNNRTHLHLAFLHYYRVLKAAPIPAETMTAVHNKIIAACVGKDGGVASDEFLNNPSACKFKLETLLCKTGDDGKACLTKAQLGTLAAIYHGPVNPRNGHVIFPGLPIGAEKYFAQLGAYFTQAKGPSDLNNWQLGDKFDGDTFDFDKDVTALDKEYGPDINALNADLSAFRRHGGKLIMYHGWEDIIGNPHDSIGYYERLAPGTAKLFMVPGMSHCSGGSGLDTFGADYRDGWPTDPEHDMLAALDRWVETGKAPEKVVAGKFSGGFAMPGMPAPPPGPPKLLATRPLCAYPNVANYDGHGDKTKAESFMCVKAPTAKFGHPAPEYLK